MSVIGNAIGWETIDLNTGLVVGGGTFNDRFTGSGGTSNAAGESTAALPSLPTIAGMGGADGTDAIGVMGGIGADTSGTVAPGKFGLGQLGTGIDNINKYFIRGTIVILGFVFVAAGLALFGRSVVK